MTWRFQKLQGGESLAWRGAEGGGWQGGLCGWNRASEGREVDEQAQTHSALWPGSRTLDVILCMGETADGF